MHRERKRVLVVDDNAEAANVLAELLQLDGHTVAIAYGGQQGIATAIEFRPDVAVLDLGMPAPDGFEMAATLRRHVSTNQVVLIAWSAWNDQATKEKARLSGFDLHVTKPAELPFILDAVAGTTRLIDSTTPIAHPAE
ncbi:response regulator [Duganella callida]|uniref:Response regulator n=1 Tax=Duganella callida TaxID=2561932 RepID=A0A4Y9SN62_9BURK|nr:response regulator [Duganella callida]TFW27978.1 response regulator [Duganella callida]